MERAEPEGFRAALIDDVGDAVLVIERDGVVRFANRSARVLFGWSERPPLGRSVFELVHPDDRARVAGVLVGTAEAGHAEPVELRVTAGAEGTRWVEAVANSRVDDPEVGGVVVSLRDLTDRLAQRAALVEAEERFRLAFEHAPIGMALVAPDGRWLRVNAALCDLVGHDEERLLRGTFQEVTHPDDLDSDLELVARVLAGEIDSYTLEKRYLRSDGEVVWALLSVSLARDADGEPRYFISQLQDIDARKRAEMDLLRTSRLDPLTGVANRRHFEERLHEALESDESGRAGILFVDLDDLKAVNDLHGHAVGDDLLKVVAARLRDTIGSHGDVARWGGDEFIALLSDVAAEAPGAEAPGAVPSGAAAAAGSERSLGEALARWVERAGSAMQQPVALGPIEVKPTVSIGASLLAGEAVTASTIIARADEEMYRSKRARPG